LPVSLTQATIEWLPASSVVETAPPDPKDLPLSVHCNELVRLPSCLSDAEPVNEIEAPSAKLVPAPGLAIETVGAVLDDVPPPG
jgi:hypothetical protein